MGQGTDSAGGYDVVYDPYHEHIADGNWVQSDGSLINVSDMTLRHLRNARRVAVRESKSASFSCDSENFNEWVELFDLEIEKRQAQKDKTNLPSKEKPANRVEYKSRGLKSKMVCHCGIHYEARLADLKRGWGFSCSKSCASIRREYKKPKAKPVKEL